MNMTSPRKKIVLLGAAFTTNNMGVWALASGAIASALHSYPDADVSLLDYNTESKEYDISQSGCNRKIQLVNLRYSKKVWQPNHILRLLFMSLLMRSVPSRTLRRFFVSRNAWLRHIVSADCVGSIAGGDSFSDIYGLARLIYVALPQILVLLLERPLVLLPQTLGPFQSRAAKKIARYIFSHAEAVYSREKDCPPDVVRLIDGAEGKLHFSHDLGFALEPRIDEERLPSWLRENNSGRPLVGINVSGLLHMGGYTQNNMFGLKSDYPRLIHAIISHLVGVQRCHVLLVPHVFGSNPGGESDVIACRRAFDRLAPEIKNFVRVLDDRDYDHHELKAVIGKCDFFIGSRMHACIAALSQGIPAIGLAYSQKFWGVFASIGMGGLAVDLRRSEEKAVISLIDKIFLERRDFEEQLNSQTPIVRISALSLFPKILHEIERNKPCVNNWHVCQTGSHTVKSSSSFQQAEGCVPYAENKYTHENHN